jgi:hypothetical protein
LFRSTFGGAGELGFEVSSTNLPGAAAAVMDAHVDGVVALTEVVVELDAALMRVFVGRFGDNTDSGACWDIGRAPPHDC